ASCRARALPSPRPRTASTAPPSDEAAAEAATRPTTPPLRPSAAVRSEGDFATSAERTEASTEVGLHQKHVSGRRWAPCTMKDEPNAKVAAPAKMPSAAQSMGRDRGSDTGLSALAAEAASATASITPNATPRLMGRGREEPDLTAAPLGG